MKKISKTLAFSILTGCILLSGCMESEDDQGLIELDGTYEGTFTVEYSNGGLRQSNPVTISFSDSTYVSSVGENRFPAGGNGKYELGVNTIIFSDENFWTADFDWNLILNGEYSVIVSENVITLTANKNDVGVYTYELTR